MRKKVQLSALTLVLFAMALAAPPVVEAMPIGISQSYRDVGVNFPENPTYDPGEDLFNSANWSPLNIHLARAVVAYDIAQRSTGDHRRIEFENWLKRTKELGIEPYVVLGPSELNQGNEGYLAPTVAQYEAAVETFVSTYGPKSSGGFDVRLIGAWNEPNEPEPSVPFGPKAPVYLPNLSHKLAEAPSGSCESTSTCGPKMAAGYWTAARNAMGSACGAEFKDPSGKECAVVAGEFNGYYGGTGSAYWAPYVANISESLFGSHNPIVSIHAWHDANPETNCSTSSEGSCTTHSFANWLGEQGGAWARAKLWDTEAGSKIGTGENDQNTRLQQLLEISHNNGVARLYYYQFEDRNKIESGLVAKGSSNAEIDTNTRESWTKIRCNENNCIQPPGVQTVNASNVGRHEAELHAYVNPAAGSLNECGFKYGTTDAYGSTISVPNCTGLGVNPIYESVNLSKLSPGTTYHFRAYAVSSRGSTEGADMQLTTAPPLPPSVITEPAASVLPHSATLVGSVIPNESATEYWFEWGTGTGYGNQIPIPAEALGSGTTSYSVQQILSGLAHGTTYHYRVVAASQEGTSYGLDREFTTPVWLPSVALEPTEGVRAQKATLRAVVNPQGADTKVQFKWGETKAYGETSPVPALDAGSGSEKVPVSTTLSGLKPGTTYYFMAVATSEEGSGSSEGGSFTTPNALPKVTTESIGEVMDDQGVFHAQLNPNGFDTHYQVEYGTTSAYGSAVPVPSADAGSGSEAIAVSQAIGNLKANTVYHARLMAISEEGVVYGEDATFTTAPPAAYLASSFGAEGTGNGQFRHPADVARDAKGNLWVVDLNNGRVEKFNEAGEYLSKFGAPGPGNGQFKAPDALAVDPTGNLWVLDGTGRVQKFNEAGEYQTQFGSSGTGNGQLSGAQGLAIDPAGNIWVADTGNARVQEFNAKGEFVKVVGSKGTGPGQFTSPAGIDVGPGGNVYVTDSSADRVEVFNSAGEYLRQFGSEGSGNAQFNKPDGISVDSRGAVWVMDQGNSRVQELTETGEYLAQFGSAGSGAGQLSLGAPMGIAADSKGDLWLTDPGNNRVEKWLG